MLNIPNIGSDPAIYNVQADPYTFIDPTDFSGALHRHMGLSRLCALQNQDHHLYSKI